MYVAVDLWVAVCLGNKSCGVQWGRRTGMPADAPPLNTGVVPAGVGGVAVLHGV